MLRRSFALAGLIVTEGRDTWKALRAAEVRWRGCPLLESPGWAAVTGWAPWSFHTLN